MRRGPSGATADLDPHLPGAMREEGTLTARSREPGDTHDGRMRGAGAPAASGARPLVSVIIPAYNAAPFIRAALRSVAAQTYRNLEVIVVDDGSTDDTCEQVLGCDPTITLVRQPNGGAAVARNTGIERSHGAYVAFLDADDVWLPRKVERLVDALERRPGVAAAYHGYAAIDEAGMVIGQPVIRTHNGDFLEAMLLSCLFGPPMAMIRRACLDRIGLFDPALRLGQDWDLFLRMALAGCQFHGVPEVLVHCRTHGRNSTRDPEQAAAYTRLVLDRALADSRLPERLRRPEFRAAAYKTHAIFYAARCLRDKDHWEDGIELLLDAVRQDPGMLTRPSTYLDLALRTLPPGDRTWPAPAHHADRAVTMLIRALDELLRMPDLPSPAAGRRRQAWCALWMAASVLYTLGRRYLPAVSSAGRALRSDPLTLMQTLVRAASGRWLSIPSVWRPARNGAMRQP